MIALFLLQAATAAMPAPVQAPAPAPAAARPARWSVLAPPDTDCPKSKGNEIVVCSNARPTQRLPLPGERGPPDRPVPSNPEMSARTALSGGPSPCSASLRGCTTGFNIVGAGVAAVRLAGKAMSPDSCCDTPTQASDPVLLVKDMAHGVKRLFARKPDKSNRIPIPLD